MFLDVLKCLLNDAIIIFILYFIIRRYFVVIECLLCGVAITFILYSGIPIITSLICLAVIALFIWVLYVLVKWIVLGAYHYLFYVKPSEDDYQPN